MFIRAGPTANRHPAQPRPTPNQTPDWHALPLLAPLTTAHHLCARISVGSQAPSCPLPHHAYRTGLPFILFHASSVRTQSGT
jgi:hypothetical protein